MPQQKREYPRARKWADVEKDPRVDFTSIEGADGYWINLSTGWRSITTETHTVHEHTVKAAIADFNDIERCDCADCRSDTNA